MPEIIFNPQAGRVKRIVTSDSSIPAMLSFPDLDYTSYRVILNSANLQTNPKFQVTEVLGGNVLLVSFGESVGPVMVNGLLFELTCESDVNDGRGVTRLLDWWTEQNVTRRTTPIELTIGSRSVIRAFLGPMTLAVTNPEDRIWSFSMQLMRIPNRSELDEARFDAVPGPDEIVSPSSPLTITDIPPVTGLRVSAASLINLDGSIAGLQQIAYTPTGFDNPLAALQNPL